MDEARGAWRDNVRYFYLDLIIEEVNLDFGRPET